MKYKNLNINTPTFHTEMVISNWFSNGRDQSNGTSKKNVATGLYKTRTSKVVTSGHVVAVALKKIYLTVTIISMKILMHKYVIVDDFKLCILKEAMHQNYLVSIVLHCKENPLQQITSPSSICVVGFIYSLLNF